MEGELGTQLSKWQGFVLFKCLNASDFRASWPVNEFGGQVFLGVNFVDPVLDEDVK